MTVIRNVINGVIAGSGGGLLQTGQTTSYFPGDDGDLQAGVVHSYTALTAGQYNGFTAIVVNGKTDNHNRNCVLDNNTDLIWMKTVAASVGPGSDGKMDWTDAVNGETPFDFMLAANAASHSGWSDWRLPNVHELLSIMEMEAPQADPDPIYWPTFPASDLWTSTTQTNQNANAIRANFGTITTAGAPKTGFQAYTILCRG